MEQMTVDAEKNLSFCKVETIYATPWFEYCLVLCV